MRGDEYEYYSLTTVGCLAIVFSPKKVGGVKGGPKVLLSRRLKVDDRVDAFLRVIWLLFVVGGMNINPDST